MVRPARAFPAIAGSASVRFWQPGQWQQHLHQSSGLNLTQHSAHHRRSLSRSVRYASSDRSHTNAAVNAFKRTLDFPSATHSLDDLAQSGVGLAGRHAVLHGYLGTRRVANKSLVFAELHDIDLGRTIQLVSTTTDGHEGVNLPHEKLLDLREHTPVAVQGTLKTRQAPKRAPISDGQPVMVSQVELKLEDIIPLNDDFPRDIIMQEDTVFPPEQRHLQIRNDRGIRHALAFRSQASRLIRDELCGKQNFTEVETPLLFRSTPEGAREFLVPSRRRGFAYALPQSPQQYKQILMGSGVPRYMQIAKCFRDEDQRADRQPEFTQVDLEMAFASGQDVMRVVEGVVKRLWAECLHDNSLPNDFPRMTYQQAMSRYGSDKPDMRLGAQIRRIEYMLPVDLISKIGPLTQPIVEVMKLSISDDPQETRGFLNTFMDSAEAATFLSNPDGQPGMFIVDSRKPLQGLHPFGFEAYEQLDEMLELNDGDLVVLQARRDAPFAGGSTPIGDLRLALHRAAVSQGSTKPPTGFEFTWITDFPMFSPTVENEPGQGGQAGICATHHPFTAPKTAEDADLLVTDPLRAVADHYDLVVNGVELGGGSRRIHSAGVQEFVLREVLQMRDERVQDFAHLLDVLRAGCPPHAGMALGFDRLIAVMLGKDSVRDVIAFPKNGRGADVLVNSPSPVTATQAEIYHLREPAVEEE